VRLQMNVPRVPGRWHVPHRLWLRRIPHVDNTESFRKHVADIGEASVHRDLDAVGTTALIAVTDKAHVTGKLRNRKILSSHIAT
jgi:hypothetical protein